MKARTRKRRWARYWRRLRREAKRWRGDVLWVLPDEAWIAVASFDGTAWSAALSLNGRPRAMVTVAFDIDDTTGPEGLAE